MSFRKTRSVLKVSYISHCSYTGFYSKRFYPTTTLCILIWLRLRIISIQLLNKLYLKWALVRENLTLLVANNKAADQSAHMRSLVSASGKYNESTCRTPNFNILTILCR